MALTEWEAKLRDIIIAYAGNRAPDPFMTWYRRKNSEGFFVDDFERALVILIVARFDQVTEAEKALENTITVVEAQALKKLVDRNELPLLHGTQYDNPDDWTDSFCVALPELRKLARHIVDEKEWYAKYLLDLMLSDLKVPEIGPKTSRLAVRWLYELLPGISIDMRTYKIPIDRNVYRVVSRLGIIDPNVDKYLGDDSPADQKIQSFAKRVLPDKQWLLDEPLWSMGRKATKGGHCHPRKSECPKCLFESVCPKMYLDVIPERLGMEKGCSPNRGNSVQAGKEGATTSKQAEFAKFVDELKQKGIGGEQYRERVKQWQREHREETQTP